MPKLFMTASGNLGKDPELRFTADGQAVCNFFFYNDRQTKDGDAWVKADGDPISVTAWGAIGENAASSLQKGDRVVVFGDMRHRTWQDSEGQKHFKWDLNAEDIGISLKWGTGEPDRSQRRGPQDREDEGEETPKPPAKPKTPPKPASKPAPQYDDEEPF